MYLWQNKQHLIKEADDEDPMCYKNNDQEHIRKKLLPAKLRAFFDVQEEKLQDYNMVSRSPVLKTKYKCVYVMRSSLFILCL